MSTKKFSTKINLIIFIVICLTFSVSCFSLAKADQKEIKVGVLLPLSGFLASSGSWMKDAITMAADDINKAGGIKSMGGAKIKLIVTDTRGLPEVGMSEAERLVLSEKVCALIGAYQSSVTFTSTTVAEKYKVPYLVATSVKNEITGRKDFSHIFRHTGSTNQNVGLMVESFLDIAKETGYKVKKAAIIGENTDFGQDAEKYLKKVLPEMGIEVVLVESYPYSISDVSPIILKLKNANPDVVFITGYLADTILIVKGAAGMNFKAPFVSSGGENSPDFLKSVGNKADGNFVRVTSNRELARKYPKLDKIFSEYEKRFDHELTEEAANCYSALWILKDALERAGSCKGLRDALAVTDIGPGQDWMIEVIPKVTFDENGQNSTPPFLLEQYTNGKHEVVWPKEYRTTEPVLPKP